MNKEEIQYDILKTEFELTQRQMDKYDQLSTTAKAWAVTLWAASVGWSFQVHRPDILLVSVVVVLIFWFFDAMNKTFRQDYKKRRDEIAGILESVFKSSVIPAGAVSPQLPGHKTGDVFKNVFLPHVALPYILLCVVSILLYFGF